MSSQNSSHIEDYSLLSKSLSNIELKLEEKYPECSEFIPVIRLFLYDFLRAKKTVKESKRSKPLFTYFFSFIKSFFSFTIDLYRLRSYDALAVAPSKHRVYSKNGKLYSKHLDSLCEFVSGEKVVAVEQGGETQNVTHFVRNYSLFIVLLQFFICVNKKEREFFLCLSEEVKSYAKKEGLNLEGAGVALYSVLVNYFKRKKIYLWFFKVTKLRKLYSVVYYDKYNIAMVAALNELNGLVVEYQHGVQNDYQPMYTNWGHLKKLPLSLPKNFWVWDSVSENRVKKWGDYYGISVTVVGNLWYKVFVKEVNQRPSSSSEVKVLVALQQYPEFFSFFILDAIASTPNVTWVFREHPLLRVSESEKRKLIGHCGSVQFDEELSVGIEERLLEFDFCITGFSTVGLEAIYMGKKVIFTHVNALNGLNSYFDGKHCFYADTAKAIIDIINNSKC